ncbi:glycosyltransferase family 4 protein [Plantactinospora sp. KLBMP9567]|uniref:glycosyltransferase family 4 protein n=1 Tax=Plantactinospora sp. KLBMP9567 TaxID=3085900 RepID=UPI002981E772|nr:glycosyltransferase family 4 protein [Plantactinospora sp. KLBMP9567]MDW5329537.1 glycosyltransferase family 4 protein [Plantactinospora sp. KLBMP9567]
MSAVLVAFGAYRQAHSGAERMAWRSAQHLAARGHRVTVMTESPPAPGLATDTVGWSGSAPAGRPDVVHAFDLARPAPVLAAMRIAREADALFALTPATDAALWPDRHAGTAACRAADVIFVLTEAERVAVHRAGAPAERIVRVPQSADLAGRPDPAGFRRRWAGTGGIVLFLARRAAAKGYRRLLEASAAVWDRLPDTTFVLAGPDAGEEIPAGLLADARIRDLGVLDEQGKHDAIAACDLVCLPTTADVFPLLFVEAWSCGKPVVSGRFPGVEEVVRDGVDGVVVGQETGELATALVDLLRDAGRRAALGAAGQVRVRADFSWPRVAAQIEFGYRRAGVSRHGVRGS